MTCLTNKYHNCTASIGVRTRDRVGQSNLVKNLNIGAKHYIQDMESSSKDLSYLTTQIGSHQCKEHLHTQKKYGNCDPKNQ